MTILANQAEDKQYATEYLSNKSQIEDARKQGHVRLRLPSALEKQFGLYFTQLSRKNFYSSYYVLLIFVILVAHLLIFDVEANDLSLLIQKTINTSFTSEGGFEGLEGMLRMQFLVLMILISMLYLPKNKHIVASFQLFLSLSAASILVLLMLAYALVNDQRFLFTLEMELIIAYLAVFILIRLQIPYLLLTSLLAYTIFLMSLSIFTLAPNWGRLIVISLSMNLFGIVYAYIREYRDRELFLDLQEIKNERRQLEFLNKKTERDNQLKAELSKFYAVMSGEKDLNRLGEKMLGFLVPDLNANLGSLYLLQDERLKLIAQYGVSKEHQPRKEIALGENLLGQAALEKKPIMLDKSPEDFYALQSGLGKVDSPSLLIIPLLFDDEVVAALEIASIKPVSQRQLEFMDAASRSIATALKAVSSQSRD